MARYLLADDLTGACEAALVYAERGARARVRLAARPERACDDDVDVVALDLDSRDLTPAAARERTTALLDALPRGAPADVIAKIDSTLRGNLASVTGALLAAFPGAVAIVAPSYPAQGRTIRAGSLYEHGRSVGPSLGERFAGLQTVSLASASRDATALVATLAAFDTRAARIALADAECAQDLTALVRAVGDRPDVLWIGSAGIIAALADDALGRARPAHRPARARPFAATAPVLFLVGSRSGATREQVAHFRTIGAVETLDARTLLHGAPEVAAAVARAARALDTSGVALVTIGDELHRDEAAVRGAFVAATIPLTDGRPHLTTVLSGGAIARAFCDARGIDELALCDRAVAGMPRARALGAPSTLVTKAGGFGRADAYREVLDALREECAP